MTLLDKLLWWRSTDNSADEDNDDTSDESTKPAPKSSYYAWKKAEEHLDVKGELTGKFRHTATLYDERDRRVYVLTDDIIGYKAGRSSIIKLKIPEGARVVYPHQQDRADEPKFRASKVEVVDIGPKSSWTPSMDHSIRNNGFKYRKGETVEPDWFDDDVYTDCSHGIHFFESYETAVRWWTRSFHTSGNLLK